MNTPLEICESRDIKGLYKMAREGKIKEFTGISDPYEEPVGSELVIMPELTVIESVKKIAVQLWYEWSSIAPSSLQK